MRTVIAVPCMDSMPVHFVQSLLFMEKPDDVRCVLASGSLVYDSRNELINRAKEAEADRILFIDSDMQFDRDLMVRLGEDIADDKVVVLALPNGIPAVERLFH